MTATERLRQLLDERGVEWSDLDTRTGEPSDYVTDWNVPDAGWAVAREIGGYLSYTWVMGERPTPEQAVEATLGRGTCHVAYKHPEYPCSDDEICSECGASFYCYAEVNFCPTCGRRVEL